MLLVRIPTMWVVSGPNPRCLYLAIWRDEENSFAQLVFLFSPVAEFQQKSGLARERSGHPVRASCSTANQIAHSSLPQRVRQPLASLPVSEPQGRTFSRATWIFVEMVSETLEQAVQQEPVFLQRARVSFREQQSLPVRVFLRPESNCKVIRRKTVSA